MEDEKVIITLTKEEALSLAMAICGRIDDLKHLKKGAESVIPDEENARKYGEELQLLEPLYKRVLRA